MSTQYIQLKNPSGDLLYPRTDWSVILNRPSFATTADVNAKQDKLDARNSGENILIETVEGGILRISAPNLSNYLNLTNKPTINGILVNGALTSTQLGIPSLDATSEGDFEIADEQGNVVLRLVEGHLVTKNFDSRTDIPAYTSQLTNNSGFLIAEDIPSIVRGATVQAVEYTYAANIFTLKKGDHNVSNNTVMTVNMTTGALDVYRANGAVGFSSHFVMNQLQDITEGACTDTYCTSIHLSDYDNDANYLNTTSLNTILANYVTTTALNTALSLKQNSLTNANAGQGIVITNSGGVTTISTNIAYASVTGKPRIGNVELVGNVTYSALKIPYINSVDNIPFEIGDDNGNIAFRITQSGNIVSQAFDSELVLQEIESIKERLDNLENI